MNNLNYIGNFLQGENLNKDLIFSSDNICEFITPYYKQHLNTIFRLDALMNFLYSYILDRNQFAMNIHHNNDILELIVSRGNNKAFIQCNNDETYLIDICKKDAAVLTYNANDEKEVFAILVLKFFN